MKFKFRYIKKELGIDEYEKMSYHMKSLQEILLK